jgi:hypothetical protein
MGIDYTEQLEEHFFALIDYLTGYGIGKINGAIHVKTKSLIHSSDLVRHKYLIMIKKSGYLRGPVYVHTLPCRYSKYSVN